MKIHSSNNIDKINTYTEVNSKMSSKELEASNSLSVNANNQDEVLLSESAVKFSMLKERLSALPDVRADLVAELKSRIQKGDYQIDSEKIADKLIEESLIG
jgi:negative regulator of flagellin synthesis FlgM